MFQILCGILRAIGMLFGWTYEEVSVHICIEWWPIICIVSSLGIVAGLILRIIKRDKRLLSLYLLPISLIYTLVLYWIGMAMIHYYLPGNGETIHCVFMKCMHDLQHIASVCHTTYAHVNMVIYAYLFMLVMLFHGVLTWMAFPKRRKKSERTQH